MGIVAARGQLGHTPRLRERNTPLYRLAHWPIWIFVFFIAVGPATFDLFDRGFDHRLALWLVAVLFTTAIAGLRGRLPGLEPKPYILRFTEDKPNLLYRRVCYTVAWGDLVCFTVLNLAGLVYAVAIGEWRLRQLYTRAYFPLAIVLWICGALGLLPRVRLSTKGEGTERRYFYGTVWAVSVAESILGFLWKALPRTHITDIVKLLVFVGVLLIMGLAACLGWLPRTGPVAVGESAVLD